MINCYKWPIGVCSWSAHNDLKLLAELKEALAIEYMHLSLGPAMEAGGDAYLDEIISQGWKISCAMTGTRQEDYSTLDTIKVTGGIMPDEYWEDNRKSILKAIDLTEKLSVKNLSFHAGFIDYQKPENAAKLLKRMKEIVDAAQEKGVTILMETGQETADDLKRFLLELDSPAVGVNFDPANMILYARGTPVAAARTLGPWIKHIHAKDAVKTQTPGTWGTEVPWGKGQVGGNSFLDVLKEVGFDGVLAIEREAGESRFDDIKLAADRLSSYPG